VIVEGPNLTGIGQEQRCSVLAEPVPKQLEHLSRIIDAKVANRQAREMHANLACANAKL
jgi:hypothetical protein